MLHGNNDALGPCHQVHGAAHAGDHFAGDHPVGEVALFIDLQAAKHGEIQVASANEAKGHRAVKSARARESGDRPPARVGKGWVRQSLLRHGAGSNEAIFRLEEDIHAGRDEVGHERWDADAEIDKHAGMKLQGDAPRDQALWVHRNQGLPTR
jgi:hypothetical protein